MTELTIVAQGLRFPEGPVALSDGSVVVAEVAAGRITRVGADGATSVVAQPGGGPNGFACTSTYSGVSGRLTIGEIRRCRAIPFLSSSRAGQGSR